jgi:hypothetical protein
LNGNYLRNRNRYSSKQFNRKTKFSFPRLVTYFTRLVFGSVDREAAAFLEELSGDGSLAKVGSGTIAKARKKLKPAVFRELLHKAVGFVYSTSSDLECPGDTRILATDGSRVTLPDTPEIRGHFDPKAGGEGTEGAPQARVSICFDVLNGIVIDALIKPLAWGERRMATKHLRFLGEGDLLLLDRGYAGVAFFKRIRKTGANILARVKLRHSREVIAFVASGRKDATIRLTSNEGSIALRAIRIELTSGITEVLLTSLTDRSYDPEFFAKIYRLRWGVESQYHFLKAPLQLANFSGKSILAVKQDFYAHVFASSLAAMLVLPVHAQIAGLTADCKHTYQLGWTDAFSVVRRKLATLLLGGLEASRGCLDEILDHLRLPRCRHACRYDRIFPRLKKLRTVRFPMNQKTV